jgi:MYXO-CTERM domain-containing protein
MYPTYNAGATNMRNLTQDDITGICDVYHPDGERTVLDDMGDKITPGDACDPTPRGGFQSACPTAGSSGCAVSSVAAPSSSLGSAFFAGVAFAAASFFARRRRRNA